MHGRIGETAITVRVDSLPKPIEGKVQRIGTKTEFTPRFIEALRGLCGAKRHQRVCAHPSHALAKRLLPRGCGAVFSFDLKGSRAQGRAFIESLKKK